MSARSAATLFIIRLPKTAPARPAVRRFEKAGQLFEGVLTVPAQQRHDVELPFDGIGMSDLLLTAVTFADWIAERDDRKFPILFAAPLPSLVVRFSDASSTINTSQSKERKTERGTRSSVLVSVDSAWQAITETRKRIFQRLSRVRGALRERSRPEDTTALFAPNIKT